MAGKTPAREISMIRLAILGFALMAAVALGLAGASYNITAVNTTVVLNGTGAKVVETLSLSISNASISQYDASRGAYNLTLSDWQRLLNAPQLTESILNPKSGATDFSFLPGAIVLTPQGGESELIMSYDVYNVTTVTEIAPRKFQYVFNDSVLNFAHTASGQELGQLDRLNLVVPEGSLVVSAYPTPDSPKPNSVGSYANATVFSWYSQEPLNGFSFSYVATQSLQQEVLSYFSSIYSRYRPLLYLLVVMVVGVLAAYVYLKFVEPG